MESLPHNNPGTDSLCRISQPNVGFFALGQPTFFIAHTVIGSRPKLGLFTPLGGVGNLEALHPNLIAFSC